MKVLLIGGCGFIGSHVVDSLLAAGMSVRVFDRVQERFRPPVPGVEYVLGDLTDIAQTYEAMSGVDALVHLASATVPATANHDPVGDISGNLITMVRLLKAMRETGLRRMVYLSSGGTVYGPPETPLVNEDHPLRPINSYGIVKVAIENYLHMEHVLHGLQHVVLRASNPYGPRHGHTGVQGIIGTHMWRMARSEPVEIWGDGSVVRDYLHVRDLAELCVSALRSDVSGCYNAGSGTGVSVTEIVDRIRQVVKRSGYEAPPVIHKPGRGFDVPRVVLDIGRARRDLGWTPRIGLEEGLTETWEWILSRKD
ncbi:NAD-dependent epimerase/dehydratase family protein [Paracoccus methylarcula]|uniref:UDP-glucose 4-epimerase n=1 Tax=Paracoccus methylarcula TaxID=72022 RepID=A0A3R7M771_9RHOB|nr:NAD-dependent epimerase/dehydratase family protein [Paracoccus methylarcula]RNF32918.1 NAD-dependent epimerase [Paracoccus methylarcula]